jgi:hypothetical protein
MSGRAHVAVKPRRAKTVRMQRAEALIALLRSRKKERPVES